ncbi:MAG: DUF2232 domain-containing protein [Erysipelotrichaceae bacterium]
MHNNVKRITEGSMMVALVGVALFFNRQMAGILEYAIYWILTFPILVYTVRFGIRAAMIPAVCMVLLSFMISLPTTTFYLMSSIIIGLIYGYGVNKNWSNQLLLISTIVFTLLSYVFTTIVFAAFFGYDMAEDAKIVSELVKTLNIYLPGGIDSLITTWLIVSTVAMSVLQGLCIHLLAILLLKRLHIKNIQMKSMLDIRLPKWVGYICIIIWLLFLSTNVLKLESNVNSMILSAYFCVVGISLAYGSMCILSYIIISGKRKLVFILPILILLPGVNVAVMALGIYDMVVDLKGKLKRGIMNGTIRKL